MIWLTADTHFFHSNIILYTNRPFANSHEMNKVLLDNINSVVKPNDALYHLGDFGMFKNDIEFLSIVPQINCNIHLCIGSHDKSFIRFEKKCNPTNVVEMEYVYEITYKGQHLFLSHYLHKVWPRSHYGSFHCHGHSHGRMDEYDKNEGKILDVGVDSHNFMPWSFDEVVEVMKTRPDNFNLLANRGKNGNTIFGVTNEVN